MVNEATPLNSSQGMQQEATKFVSNLFTDENIKQAQANISGKVDDLRRSASDGDFSIRLLALLGGLALMLSSVTGIVGHFLHLDITGMLMEVYTFMLAAVILVLESRQLNLPSRFMQSVYKYALFLKFVWGRGVLYFVAGSLQLSQGTLLDYGVGGFVMLVGVLYIVVGKQTAQRLQDLRRSIYSQDTLRAKFREADTESKGTLDMVQFHTVVASLGMDLNRRETEAAFDHMDKSLDGSLSFEEFLSWWSDWDLEDPDRNNIV